MKVNTILSVLIEYVNRKIEGLKKEKIEEYSDFILELYEEKMVIPHKTNYVQYFLLYIFSNVHMQIFREKFISLLFLKAFDNSAAINLRLRSINYLGSFLASTKSLNIEILCSVLRMIKEKLEECNPKIRSHLIQLFLYIINYKWPYIDKNIKLLKKIISNSSLLYVEETILLETALLLQKLDVMKYAEEILTLEKAVAEQRKRRIHAVKAYFLFTVSTVMLPIIKQEMGDAIEQYTYRQILVIKDKNGSIDSTNS